LFTIDFFAGETRFLCGNSGSAHDEASGLESDRKRPLIINHR
jgi:hypothetical protein